MEIQYFSHDYNASRDIKMRRLHMTMGYEGIGLYWTLVEYLYENDNYCALSDLDIIAYDMHTTEELLRQLIENFNLFEIEGDYFYSASIRRRMDKRSATIERNKNNAKKRYDKESRSATEGDVVESRSATECNVVESRSATSESSQGKIKIKEKENNIKEKENNTSLPPLSPKGKNRATTKFDFDEDNPPEWIDPRIVAPFKTWLVYKRTEKHSGYASEQTARTCYEQLMKTFDGDIGLAINRINMAIANGYIGLVWDSDRHGTPRQKSQNPQVINTANKVYETW